ncbi:MAG: FCD domain-containing protein [Chitinivibrionales bacterium]|nr:FCD domain-containing protein [Chitinivibrionales bacterium]
MHALSTQTIEHRSLADQVFAHVKRLILSGELKAGQRVPELRIAEELGVSRTPIREAIRRLEQYGLVHIKPRSFAEVAAMDPAEVDQLAEVRAQVECLSARLFAARATAQDCTALRVIAAECRELLLSGDLAGAYEKDSEFHLEIAERCGNAYVFDIMERLDARIQLARLVRCADYEHVLGAVEEHARLIDAFARRATAEAVSFMSSHVKLMAPDIGGTDD